MNLVDSCGRLEYFADSPYADFYSTAIEDTGYLIVPEITGKNWEGKKCRRSY